MPYLKFSRDKRGYEYFSIVEPGATRRGRPPRPRVLFWFRTPPQIRVGRHPFTDEVRREIEERNPSVRFDWVRLLATPIPPPDAENWRERRRVEKAARQAAREAEVAEQATPAAAGQPATAAPLAALAEADPAIDEGDDDAGLAAAADLAEAAEEASDEEGPAIDEMAEGQTLPAADSSEPAAAAEAGTTAEPGGARRRKRRRRRRRHHPGEQAASPAPNGPSTPTEEV